jgi:hypothetical protein
MGVTMPDFSSLAPYGIGIVAVVALVALAMARKPSIVAVAMVLIVIIVAVDYFYKPTPAKSATNVQSAPQAPQQSDVHWVDTNVLADWGGRDRDLKVTPRKTNPHIPLYQADNGNALCDDAQRGVVAVCWDSWCTYKKPEVHIGTLIDGKTPGRVYVCGRDVQR